MLSDFEQHLELEEATSFEKRDKLQFIFATWAPSIVADIQYVSNNGN